MFYILATLPNVHRTLMSAGPTSYRADLKRPVGMLFASLPRDTDLKVPALSYFDRLFLVLNETNNTKGTPAIEGQAAC
jgi:hypothetical protein